ncbi:MAG TPA: hypothetical protein VGD58_14300 [Herpetosiphonaceae bacterium]
MFCPRPALHPADLFGLARPERRLALVFHNRVRSADKQLVWFERSGHALLDDCDSSEVLTQVHGFLHSRLAQPRHEQEMV